jgi:hypothetical protein
VIDYNLPVGAEVTIVIFDIMGRKIETLFEGYQAAGIHKQSWDAEGIPSGVYFYKLNAGDLSEVRQMVLMK